VPLGETDPGGLKRQALGKEMDRGALVFSVKNMPNTFMKKGAGGGSAVQSKLQREKREKLTLKRDLCLGSDSPDDAWLNNFKLQNL